MKGEKKCYFCGELVESDASSCPFCDADLEEKRTQDELDKKDYLDSFSELDYDPEKKKNLFAPLLVIGLVLVIGAALAYIVLGDFSADHIAEEEEDRIEVKGGEEDEQELVEDPVELENEADLLELPEEDIEEITDAGEPDFSRLNEAMFNWLVGRTGDGELIMLDAEELEDMDRFFARYDLEEDNVIVYRMEAPEDRYATVLFGLPFSEWSIRAVFIWRDGKWSFLREEPV